MAALDVLMVVGATVLGALFGSFANVPIHRWPRGGTVTTPRRSSCPACDAPIRAHDNVPVVSWLVLRARCRDCGAPIAARYAVVEAVTAGLFGAVAAVHLDEPALVPALLALTWMLVVASAIDLEHRIIPNRLTYPTPAVLVVLLALATLGPARGVGDLRRAVVVGVVVPGVMLVISEVYRLVRGRAGIGMGDVKLAVSIGLVLGFLGPWHAVVFAYTSVGVAVLVAAGLVLSGRARLASRIPFGPYLAGGALIAVLAGDALIAQGARWLGLG